MFCGNKGSFKNELLKKIKQLGNTELLLKNKMYINYTIIRIIYKYNIYTY